MKIQPRVYTFKQPCPLDPHTNSKHTHSLSRGDARFPGPRNAKQLAIHLGFISCPGEPKQSRPWQTWHPFHIIDTTTLPSFFHRGYALLAQHPQALAWRPKATAKSPVTLHHSKGCCCNCSCWSSIQNSHIVSM